MSETQIKYGHAWAAVGNFPILHNIVNSNAFSCAQKSNVKWFGC